MRGSEGIEREEKTAMCKTDLKMSTKYKLCSSCIMRYDNRYIF